MLNPIGLGPFNDSDAQIAAELAFDLSPVEDICSRHGISRKELTAKLRTPTFANMVKEAKRFWKSDLSVKERIRLKSMLLVEDSLLELFRIFHDKDMSANARLDAFKSLSKVATVDTPDKDGQSVGEKVSITINIPGAPKPITIEASTPAGVSHEGEAFSDGAPNQIADASGGR